MTVKSIDRFVRGRPSEPTAVTCPVDVSIATNSSVLLLIVSISAALAAPAPAVAKAIKRVRIPEWLIRFTPVYRSSPGPGNSLWTGRLIQPHPNEAGPCRQGITGLMWDNVGFAGARRGEAPMWQTAAFGRLPRIPNPEPRIPSPRLDTDAGMLTLTSSRGLSDRLGRA